MVTRAHLNKRSFLGFLSYKLVPQVSADLQRDILTTVAVTCLCHVHSAARSHSFSPCHAHCILFLYMLSHQLYFLLFEKEILELLTKVLRKYRVIVTLLRIQRFYFVSLCTLWRIFTTDLFKSASSAPCIRQSKTTQKMLEVWKWLQYGCLGGSVG